MSLSTPNGLILLAAALTLFSIACKEEPGQCISNTDCFVGERCVDAQCEASIEFDEPDASSDGPPLTTPDSNIAPDSNITPDTNTTPDGSLTYTIPHNLPCCGTDGSHIFAVKGKDIEEENYGVHMPYRLEVKARYPGLD